MLTFLQSSELPPTNGYSHAVRARGDVVFISGQVPLDASGALVGAGNVEDQVVQVFVNLTTALESAGASMADVTKLTYFLTDLADLAVVRAVRDRYISATNPPASSLIQVAGLVHPDFRIEVEAYAVL